MNDVERAFRQHGARLHAALGRRLGADNLELVETALQDAFEEALRRWPAEGAPERPDGWLLAVARNRALDRLRRDVRFAARGEQVAAHLEGMSGRDGSGPGFGWELPDDLLAMMFVACHPALPLPSRAALTLRTLCGLGVPEISGALLSSPEAVKKLLVRARSRLRDAGAEFALPDGEALDARLPDVLRVLWLLFAEGHGAHTGDLPIRPELCGEALRLARVLARHPRTDRPVVHALVALMALHASRLPARVEGGRAIPLDRQDRARWDGALIREGLEHLAEAATGDATTYHLEAGIAACHAIARRAEDTDWARILAWYDRLVALDPSPVVAVQRAIAVGRVLGAGAGLEALDALADARLVRWAVFHAARGDLLRDLGRTQEARDAWESAVALAPTEPERRTLRDRIA